MAELSKTDANYISHTVTRGEKCADCSMFREPDSCTLVKGKIAKVGHCRYWEKKNV